MTKKKPKLNEAIELNPKHSGGKQGRPRTKKRYSMDELNVLINDAKKQLEISDRGTKPVKKKKKLLEESIEVKEHREQREEIKRKKPTKESKKETRGRRPMLQVMQDDGEDKVIAQKIYILAAKGYSRKDIRKKLKLKLSTWHTMMEKQRSTYPIYREALDRGEDYAIEDIEEAMKSSAIGYDYLEETIDLAKGVARVTRKHVKPDVKAGQFLLTNKRPQEYKYKRTEIDHNINVKKEIIDYENLPLSTINNILENVKDKDVVASIPKKDSNYES
jgi:hypothetical protein